MDVTSTGNLSSFYVTGGTIPLDAASYVVREADDALFENLMLGEYCYVLTTRQMGKSSLMVRTARRLRKAGVTAVVLDLTAIGQNVSPEQWYNGLLVRLGRQLDLEDELDQFFLDQTHLGPMQRFMEAIGHIVLNHVQGPIVLFIDEIDAVRSLPFGVDEFFAAIRECHNRRVLDVEFNKLTYCLLGVATPSDLIADPRISPFNIGCKIELKDFTQSETSSLARGLATAHYSERSSLSGFRAAVLRRVFYWTNGHPYMTQRLFRAVAESADQAAGGPNDLVDRACETLFFSKSARQNDDNLAFVRNRLLRDEGETAALLSLYRRVLSGDQVADEENDANIETLRLSGIVRSDSGFLSSRNRIYARVFDRSWIAASMPDAEVRRQKEAYRAGVLRSAIIGGVMVFALGGLTISSFIFKRRADASARLAQQQALYAQESTLREAKSRRQAELSRKLAADLAASEKSEREYADQINLTLERQYVELFNERSAAIRNAELATKSERRALGAEARARAAKLLAQTEAARANHLLYDTNINLVQREYESHEYERMKALLGQTRNAPDRGFEWRFWNSLCPLVSSVTSHESEVLCVAASRDGTRFATGGADRVVQIYDSATGRNLRTWREEAQVHGLAFGPDGDKIAVALAETGRVGAAVVRSIQTGRRLLTVAANQRGVWSVAFSPNGRQLATNGERLQLWDCSRGTQENDLGPGGAAVAFSPDGGRICFSRWCEKGRPADVDLYDLTGGRETVSLASRNPGREVRTIAWSPDGEMVAVGGDDRLTYLRRAETGELIRAFAGHNDSVVSAAFSPDGLRLVTTALDDEARVWDVDRQIRTNPAIPPAPAPREFLTPMEERMANRETRLLLKHVRQAVFLSKGARLATGSYSGAVRIWSSVRPASYLVLEGPPSRTTNHLGAVVCTRDGRVVASSINNRVASLWDAQTGAQKRFVRIRQADISTLAFDPTGDLLVSGAVDGSVHVWDTRFGRELRLLSGHRGAVTAIAIDPTGRRVVTCGEDRLAFVSDLRTGRRLFAIGLNASVARGVSFVDGDRYLIFAQTENVPLSSNAATAAAESNEKDRTSSRFTMWDAANGRFVRLIAATSAHLLCFAISPDGLLLAAGADDKTVRIWDRMTGHAVPPLKGHNDGVNAIAFSADGRRLVTGSFDTNAKLWDARTGREILTLHHPSFVVGVSFSPNGKQVITACEDGSTRIWRAD